MLGLNMLIYSNRLYAFYELKLKSQAKNSEKKDGRKEKN